jgi:hypothetical protein
MAIKLSPSQVRAEDEFRNFVLDNSQSEMVISGFAGSGKSFLVKYLRTVALQQMQVALAIDPKAGWKTFYTATTNKAASVLQGFLGESVQTIHSLLGLKVTNDFKTGKVKLEPTDKTKELGKALVFIDEASMVSRNLLGHIRSCMTPGQTKIVFIGDRYQLAPVGEGHSIVFHNPKNIVHLKEIQRQVAGSPIIQTSQLYREILDTGLKQWPQISPSSPEINIITGTEFQDLIDQKFTASHDIDDLKILAWTNARVIAYNKHVRRLYTQSQHLIAGEKVMTNKPILTPNRSFKFKNKVINTLGGILHPTDAVLEITRIEPANEDGVNGFGVSLNYGPTLFMPESWQMAKAKMRHYANDANWKAYFHIKDNWLDLRPLHALTCHKSQGSTYKEVFIDMADIGENKKWEEIARLMYVAVSRASAAVYLYGSLKMRNWRNTSCAIQ